MKEGVEVFAIRGLGSIHSRSSLVSYSELTTEGLGHPPFRDCGTTGTGTGSGRVCPRWWTRDSCVIL